MVKRVDPARTGVKAGRVVGLLTAALAVVTLWQGHSSFAEGVTLLLSVAGVEASLPVVALFWGNAVLVAVIRYTVCYVVGSLVGVLYDWLDRPPLPALVAVILLVGAVDGFLAGIDTDSVAVGTGYVLAWLCYVPAFVWLFDAEVDDAQFGPPRLG